MAYHIRTPFTDELGFSAFTNDRITKGDAYIRYDERDICLGHSYNTYGNEVCVTLWAYDVTNAFKTGKSCIGFRLEALGDEASNRLQNYLAVVNYNIPAFIDWCASLDVDFESYNDRYVDKDRRISISKREPKGVETFSPLALSHLKPLKEIPAKWSLSHVRRLLAAGQYSYCGTELRLTDDYAYDAASEFGKGECSGEAFLKELIESPSGWRVSQCNGSYQDGDNLAIWCHTFEKRVIKIDLTAPTRRADQVKQSDVQTNFPVANDRDIRRPAGILMH